jgi:hypothetical protein
MKDFRLKELTNYVNHLMPGKSYIVENNYEVQVSFGMDSLDELNDMLAVKNLLKIESSIKVICKLQTINSLGQDIQDEQIRSKIFRKVMNVVKEFYDRNGYPKDAFTFYLNNSKQKRYLLNGLMINF